MPVVITADAYLVINTIPMATPAWRITDLSALLDDAPVTGDDRRISGATGRRPYPRVRDTSTRTLPLSVFGAFDKNGATYTDPRQGLIDNVEALKAGLGIASGTGDGTVEAVWHRFDDSTARAQVHVLGLKGFRRVSPAWVRTTLDLSIPAGVFTVDP